MALGPLRKFMPGGDVGLALCVLFQLSILILPIPTFLLDMALALSFIASILILLVSFSLERPLDFSSLPTLLLLTTILRLSLNVATARLILSHGNEGPYAAGQVVAAFGTFLMGGDVVVGAIVFAMLLLVNFIVITKGSSRIAEVSARFYLDSMPGKQMAIDADLSSGIIDEPTARIRRGELSEESGFYGAMDGASKFVRGDAICALIITLINIFGGLAMGLVRAHMSIDSALATYTTLTVGDGLVSQIPALLVSTAAGIVVSKGAIEGKMHGKLASQLGSNANPLMIASAAAGVLALLPGLPTLPFLVVSLVSGIGGVASVQGPRPPNWPKRFLSCHPRTTVCRRLAMLDVVRVELGYGLLDLASGGAQQFRSKSSACGGRWRRIWDLPCLRCAFRTTWSLIPTATCSRLRKSRRERANSAPDDAGHQSREITPSPWQAKKPPNRPSGFPPAGLPQPWRSRPAPQNWTVVDPATVLTTHLAEVVKENIAEFLSYTETQKILAGLPNEQQKLVADLVPSVITVGGLQRVLQMLLAERISIRDMPTILEAVQEACAGNGKSVGAIVAHVRTRLSRQISDSLIGPSGYYAHGGSFAGMGRLALQLAGRAAGRSSARTGPGQASRVSRQNPKRHRFSRQQRRETGAADQHECPDPCLLDCRSHQAERSGHRAG